MLPAAGSREWLHDCPVRIRQKAMRLGRFAAVPGKVSQGTQVALRPHAIFLLRL
jgi:hypothetical protein